MIDSESTGRGCHNRSSTVKHFGILSSQVLLDVSDSWLDIGPWSCILGLFLCPHHFSVFILFHFADDFFEWEWAKGFNSKNCSIVLVKLLPFGLKIVIYLAWAEDDSLDLLRSYKSLRLILNKRLPSHFCIKLLDFRSRSFKS